MVLVNLFKHSNLKEFKKNVKSLKKINPTLVEILETLIKSGQAASFKKDLIHQINNQLKIVHPDKSQCKETSDARFWIAVRKDAQQIEINPKLFEKKDKSIKTISTSSRDEFLVHFFSIKKCVSTLIIKDCTFTSTTDVLSTLELIDGCITKYFPHIKTVEIENSIPQILLLVMQTCLKATSIISKNVVDVMTYELECGIEEAKNNLYEIKILSID